MKISLISITLLSLFEPAVSLGDDVFFLKNGKSCNKIGAKENRRQSLCQKEDVQEACETTCGITCADDSGFKFGKKKMTCEDIPEDEEQRAKVCGRKGFSVNSDGMKKVRRVKDACPKTCDNCHIKVEDITDADKLKFCADDNTAVLNNDKRCDWVAKNKVRTINQCKKPKVMEACRLTCRDPLECNDGKYKFDVNGKDKGCRWLSTRPEKSIIKKCANEEIKEKCSEVCAKAKAL